MKRLILSVILLLAFAGVSFAGHANTQPMWMNLLPNDGTYNYVYLSTGTYLRYNPSTGYIEICGTVDTLTMKNWTVLGSTNVSVNGWMQIGSTMTAAYVNTGNGDCEVYPMSQAVRITDAVSFAGVTNTGALNQSYVLMSDSGTLTISSNTIVSCSKSTGQQITLPTAVSHAGLTYTFKKTGAAGIVTLVTNASETIDGVDDNVLIKTQYDYITIVSNGSNWIIVGRYIQ